MRTNRKSFFPEEIIFAATNSCNLHCPHCFVNRDKLNLDIEAAKSFLNSCIEYQNTVENPLGNIQKIGFSGGEPFLYLDFLLELISFTVKNDLYFDQIMTNGDWWKDEIELQNTLQKIYDAGFDGKIGLSWDSFHNQNPQRIKTFINTVHKIFGADSLNIQYVIPYENQGGESTPLSAASEVSQNSTSSSSATPPAGTPRNAPVTAELIQELFPDVPLYQLPQSFPGTNPKSWESKKWFKDDYCQGPGNILYVHSNGNIAPCCGFANENPKLFIGTINDTFEKVLQNAAENPLINLCYTKGLSKAIKLLKKKKLLPKGKCNDICSFCDFVCENF